MKTKISVIIERELRYFQEAYRDERDILQKFANKLIYELEVEENV